MGRNLRVLAAAAALAAGAAVSADTPRMVELTPVKDNTLYEDPAGSLSNGAGEHVFAGTTVSFGTRRAVLAFDLAGALPPGAEIASVELVLRMSKTISGAHTVTLHRLLADWGEGTADAPGEEGGGTAASGGDATWIHTFSPAQFWLFPGGDFDPVASASTTVTDVITTYTWSAPGMVEDVLDWIADPSSNFGWILIGDESEIGTAKRFDSREAENRPVLRIHFDVEPVPAASTTGLVVLMLLLAGAAAVVRRT